MSITLAELDERITANPEASLRYGRDPRVLEIMARSKRECAAATTSEEKMQACGRAGAALQLIQAEYPELFSDGPERRICPLCGQGEILIERTR